MNFNKVSPEVAARYIVNKIEIKRGWDDPIATIIHAKPFSITHQDVLYGKEYMHSHHGDDHKIYDQIRSLGVYNAFHAQEIAVCVQDLLNAKIQDMNGENFTSEHLAFIEEHTNKEVAEWITSQFVEWNGGAYWCIECGRRKQFRADIDGFALYYNDCPQHTYKMEKSLPYHLPAHLRERSHGIAYHVAKMTEERIYGPPQFSGRACLADVRELIASEISEF